MEVLTVIKEHGKMPQLIAYLAQYCDIWGYTTPGGEIGIAQHHNFGTAFCLLVKVWCFCFTPFTKCA